jgi:hypothetical protein
MAKRPHPGTPKVGQRIYLGADIKRVAEEESLRDILRHRSSADRRGPDHVPLAGAGRRGDPLRWGTILMRRKDCAEAVAVVAVSIFFLLAGGWTIMLAVRNPIISVSTLVAVVLIGIAVRSRRRGSSLP